MDASLEIKLQELIDRQEIWQVLLNYSRGIDRLDRDLVRSSYFDDAIDDHHVFGGTADQFLDSAFSLHASTNTHTRHALSNHTCEIKGNDAYAETYYHYMGMFAEPPHQAAVGRYIDHLQKRDGVWKIAKRVCLIEGAFQMLPFGEFSPDAQEELVGKLPYAGRDRNDVSYQRPLVPRDWAEAHKAD